jgi:hypothetical protein
VAGASRREKLGERLRRNVVVLLFNPAYLVDLGGETVLRMQKARSVFESRFQLDGLGDLSEEEEDLLLVSLMMVLLLERDRG